MSQIWKIVVAIIITAVVVGSGVYFWQQKQQKNISSDILKNKQYAPALNIEVKKSEDLILFEDKQYKIKFVTNKECGNYFSVKEGVDDFIDENALKFYSLYVPGSKQWTPTASWFFYAIYPINTYNYMQPSEFNPKPKVVFTLDSNLILVRFEPQDGPTDYPEGCNGVSPEKL